MNSRLKWIATCLLVALPGLGVGAERPAPRSGTNKYVGAAKCRSCHDADEKGNQFAAWQRAKHSKCLRAAGLEGSPRHRQGARLRPEARRPVRELSRSRGLAQEDPLQGGRRGEGGRAHGTGRDREPSRIGGLPRMPQRGEPHLPAVLLLRTAREGAPHPSVDHRGGGRALGLRLR